MPGRENEDSDAPEEFTAEEGLQQDQELQKVQRDNKARANRERKDRLRKKAKRFSPEPVQHEEVIEDDVEAQLDQQSESNAHMHRQSRINAGMLPNDVVNMLAAKEKQVFLSDSEDEKDERKQKPKKKKSKGSGVESVIILKDVPRAPGVKNSLEFLKRRKMQVPRSSAVLDNSDQALRFLSKSGLLKSNNLVVVVVAAAAVAAASFVY
ncbi:hypothetical protein V2J09_023726 [Rumex salicifolius]